MSSEAGEDCLDTPLAALRRALASDPEALFLDFSGDEWTYARFAAEAARLARGLTALGVDGGDTVATICDTNPDVVLMWFATSMIGAIHVPINTSYKGEFLRHQLADCGAGVVLTEGEYLERVLVLADELPALRLVLDRDGRTDLSTAAVRVDSVDSHRAADGSPLSHNPSPSDIACLVYTSGTTGQSKGCILSHNFLCHVAHEFNRFSGRRAGEVNWTCLPLFHLNAMAGTVLATMMLKSSASLVPRFSLSGFWPEIERTQASVVYLLGSMTPLIADMEDSDVIQRCRGVIRSIIAAPCPAELPPIFRERFGVEHMGGSGFGQTEIGMPLTLAPGTVLAKVTNGRPTPYFDVRIFDDLDRELGSGQVGEIVVRPLLPYIMFGGYWNRPDATAETWNNLWYHTGDLGKTDDEGYFYFVDRKKDYLRRGGENISSFELEMALARHPEVIEATAFGVPSELSEDEVAVAAVLKAGSALTEREFCEWSMNEVPYFAVPRFVEFLDELPKNPVGRVLKFKLRERGLTDATWDRQEAGVKLRR
jgi:crotonobetaine/carnitine-CoA ligase